MESNQQKQQFSIAYVHAVAAAVGLKIFRSDVDDESVDIGLGQSGGAGTIRSPRLDIQVKCTEQDVLREDGVHFPLKRKNYDDLREINVMVPRILVVVLVPDDGAQWLTEVPEERICLHRSAWWMTLKGAEDRPGVESPTVVLPRANLFNVDSLREIMQTLSNRGRL
jgi:hypothetical protein